MEIQKIDFTDDLDTVLRPVLNDDLEQIKQEVSENVSELWLVNKDSYCITRLECDRNNKPIELVFVVGIGSDSINAIKHFSELVKKQGVNRFRVHSSRKGMGKLLAPLGFVDSGTVYSKVDV